MKRWMLLIGMGFMTSILQAMSLSNALQNVTSHVQTLQQVVRAKPQSIYHNPIVPQTSSSSFFTKDPRTSSQKDNVVFYGRLNLQTLSKALGNYGLRPNADILKDIPFFDYGIYANITSGGLDTIERVLKEKFGSGGSYLTFRFKVDDHKQLTIAPKWFGGVGGEPQSLSTIITTVEKLRDTAVLNGTITVDLEECRLSAGNTYIRFPCNPEKKLNW